MSTIRGTALLALAGLLTTACGSSDPVFAERTVSAPPSDGSDPPVVSDGSLPLGTSDEAARAALIANLYFSSAFDVLSGGKRGRAKATEVEDCTDGGTRTTEEDGLDRSIRYSQCLEGFVYTDGLIRMEVTSAGFPTSDGIVTIGENGTALLAENRDPLNDARTLMLGTLAGEVRIDFEGDIEEVDAVANLHGAAEDLDGQPRVDYALEGLHVNMAFEGEYLLLDELGPLRATGDCGEGQAQVDTQRRLRVHRETGAISDGELRLANASGETATVVFNADGSVDATSPGGSQHYTREAFGALCPVL